MIAECQWCHMVSPTLYRGMLEEGQFVFVCRDCYDVLSEREVSV